LVISCRARADMIVMNSLTSRNVLISHSFLKDSFAGYIILGWLVFFFFFWWWYWAQGFVCTRPALYHLSYPPAFLILSLICFYC
jgi:hypothetical protein